MNTREDLPADAEKTTGWRGSRELWLDAAKQALVETGLDAVKIQPLANRLNIARTSFYWFFKDRGALLDALLEQWEAKNTGAFVDACGAYGETISEAVLNLIAVFHDDTVFDPQLDFAVRGWAHRSDKIAARVNAADQRRLQAIRTMFERFHFAPEDADVRAWNVYLTQIGYISMQIRESTPVRMARVPAYVNAFCGQHPTAGELARFHARLGVRSCCGGRTGLNKRVQGMLARQISYDEAIDSVVWADAVDALRTGHQRPKARIADLLLEPAEGTLLSRSAHVEGLGFGVKSVTVFEANPQHGLPTVQGAMFVFEPSHGRLEAILDSQLVTDVKTAADSVFGASLLARPDSRHLLVVGAGTVARNLIAAYSAMFPNLARISIWARRPEQAKALARDHAGSPVPVTAVSDLASAAAQADIISSATLARAPILQGQWIKPGTHVDLIGAYTKDMREADDDLIAGGALYVDSRETTIAHIGELTIPIARGVISADSVIGDLYDLVDGDAPGRETLDQITIFKNGGGAHLDLMIAAYILKSVAKTEE